MMNLRKYEFSPGGFEMVIFPSGYKLTSQFRDCTQSNENLVMKILPKELILRIFSYLDVVSLCRCARVCKVWNSLALDGSNWQNIDLCRFQTDVDGSMLESLSYRSGGFLKRISLRGCKTITDNSFKFLAMSCQNLVHLNLSGCVRIGDRACQNLGLYCPCLVHLDLECCSNITDLSLVSLSLGCSSLKHVNISWCLRLTDEGLLHFLKKLSFLEVFCAKGCSQFTNQGLEGLSNCPLVTSVNIFGCERLTDSGILRITEGCAMLKLLCVSKCSRLTDVSLVCLSRNCLKLETLDVSSCSRMTDVGFVALSKNCHNLKRLDLEECTQISDTTISNLALHCPRLSHLNLSHCELLTDQSLAHLGNSTCAAESLSIVELDNCSLLTDACLVHLYGCQNLRRIELIDCQSITPGGIHRLLCHLPGLKVHAYFTPTTPPLSIRNDRRRKICKCCTIQ